MKIDCFDKERSMANVFRFDLNESNNISVISDFLNGVFIAHSDGVCTVTLDIIYDAVYGMGEKFNCVNQKNLEVEAKVYEKFCNQGEISYCPIPFFFTNTNVGVFVDTFVVTKYEFKDNIKIKFEKDSKGKWPVLYFFIGSPKEIVEAYTGITGKPLLTPKWSFGVWMSANRWNTQEEVEKQIQLQEKYNFPANVLVLEAWSDEATFYRWNEHGEWKNPQKMIDELHKKGIRLILWQIPVIKKMAEGESHEVLENDWKYAVENKLCVLNTDGTPYVIPQDHWFPGSMLPDFTNPDTLDWWFSKRKHLLDMGVDGFKTDGGEFILSDDIKVHNGFTEVEMKNCFAASYVKEYSKFIGPDRVLFSRAGYTGQQNYPMHWAGDQVSTWDELRHVLTAGLSIGLSGIPYWGFDIGGFSGPLPSVELYERSMQMSVFSPVMQWHSEPSGGQFEEIMHSAEGINDRSPWNMSSVYKDNELLERIGFHYNLRTNLLPYIYDQAKKSSETGLPMMRHLILEYPEDINVVDIEDSFMLGDILVSPVIYEGKKEKEVYLPAGLWIDLWSGEKKSGGKRYLVTCGIEKIPAFVREGSCIAFNLSDEKKLGTCVGNELESYHNLCFYVTGTIGQYHFRDDLNNEMFINWEYGCTNVKVISGNTKYCIIDHL